ncbi:hypothetical protein ACWGI9_19740 [Streptomyces sp. NPDC054833]
MCAYYFHDGPGDTSPALTVGHAADFAERTRYTVRPEARSAAAVLVSALDGLATVFEQWFLHTGGTRQQVLATYTRDHGSP